VLVAYLLLNLPIIASKPDTFEGVKVFSVDEFGICKGVAFLIEKGSFTERGNVETAGPNLPNTTCSTRPYGQLYALLIAAPLMMLQPLVAVDEPLIVRSAVVVLVVCGVLALLFTYATAARLYSARHGLLAVVLLLGTSEFLRWSNEIHPDMPQLAALMGGFYFAVRAYEAADVARRRLLYVGLAAACAGLAMAAKYNGIFLLPAIVVAYNRGVADREGQSRLRAYATRNLGYGVFCLLVFAGTFALTSPCLVANPDLAIEPFARSATASIGKARDPQPLWDRLLGVLDSNRVLAESTIGYGAYILLVMGIVHADVQLLTNRDAELRSPRILAEVYIVPFLTYSLLLGYGLTDGRLPAGYERYLLPVVPAMYICGLRIVAAAGRCAPAYRRAAIIVVAIVLLVGQATAAARFEEWYTSFRLRQRMGFFQVHDWLLENIPKGARIYTEMYIHVPEKDYLITRHYAVCTLDAMLANDYIVTKTLDYDMYSNPDRWRLYASRPSVPESRRIYEHLEQNRLPAFERIALLSAGDRFHGHDAVAVYRNVARTKPLPARDASP
jgi:hypothetical protein